MVPSKMSQSDPSGKDKVMILPNAAGDISSVHHWSKRTKIKWTITYFFGIFLVYAVRTSMSISTTAIAKELGWNKQISGMVLSAFFCGYILTNVPGGYLADRHGGEIVIFYTSIGWGILTLALPFLAHSDTLFYSGTVAILATRFLTGVTQGVFFPSIISVLAKRVSVAERGFVFSFSYSGSSVGTIATGFLGSLMIEHVGWPHVFILIGVTSLLWCIWMKYLLESTTSKSTAPGTQGHKTVLKEPVPWLQLAGHGPVWALLVAYICSSYCFYNLLSWTPVYFHDAFPESKGWVFNVIPWLLNFIFTNISGYVANLLIAGGTSLTFVRKLYGAILFLGMGVFSLMLNSVESFHQALFVMSLNIAVNAFAVCSISSNAQDLAPKHSGALHGVMNSCGAFSGFIGVYLTGYILETTQKWSAIFFLTSMVSFVGFFSFVGFGTGERLV